MVKSNPKEESHLLYLPQLLLKNYLESLSSCTSTTARPDVTTKKGDEKEKVVAVCFKEASRIPTNNY